MDGRQGRMLPLSHDGAYCPAFAALGDAGCCRLAGDAAGRPMPDP
ncbi:hypothetical protein [Niveispirillum sp. BGYR6]|nr:hypothetical protein [Niveispirillum sp. BGYR6]MDG5494007.1 hypothetical protein [Niveispirillum sp. BGYR6]